MARRKILEVSNGIDKVAKVYRDSDWEEYRVTFWVDGDIIKGADHHTGDKQDAIDTANYWVNRR